VSIFSEWFTEM